MYNSPGGYTFGQVWADPLSPHTAAAKFPANTVSIKLLFTEGTPAQIPYLAGSKTWPACIYADPNKTGPGAPRVVKTLYLLQVDVAIRDPRVDSTSWVFGTFIYDGRVPGANGYAKLRPVGLMWGNDPDLVPTQYAQGVQATQTRLYQPTQSIMRHTGWLGRLDGPVKDNPKSSCLSCHSTAQWPVSSAMTPPAGIPEGSNAWMLWFRNIPAAAPFTAGSASLDYSLQLASGIQNLAAWSNICKANPKAPVVPSCPNLMMLTRKAGPQQKRIPLGHPVHR